MGITSVEHKITLQSDIRIATVTCFLGRFDWKIFSKPFTLRSGFVDRSCLPIAFGFNKKHPRYQLYLLHKVFHISPV
ncbi:hypothetical protein STEG23_000446 [Scotinomys teguina]